MTQDQYEQTVTRANDAFKLLPEGELCDVLRVGDKNAFQRSASKKTGLDDGPSL